MLYSISGIVFSVISTSGLVFSDIQYFRPSVKCHAVLSVLYLVLYSTSALVFSVIQ